MISKVVSNYSARKREFGILKHEQTMEIDNGELEETLVHCAG
jgi:hypothetical protein